MIQGTEAHEGMPLLIDGKVYKVISATLRGKYLDRAKEKEKEKK